MEMEYADIEKFLSEKDKTIVDKVFEADGFSFSGPTIIAQLYVSDKETTEIKEDALRFGCKIEPSNDGDMINIVVPAGLGFSISIKGKDVVISRKGVELYLSDSDYIYDYLEFNVSLTDFGNKLNKYAKKHSFNLFEAYVHVKDIEDSFGIHIIP